MVEQLPVDREHVVRLAVIPGSSSCTPCGAIRTTRVERCLRSAEAGSPNISLVLADKSEYGVPLRMASSKFNVEIPVAPAVYRGSSNETRT